MTVSRRSFTTFSEAFRPMLSICPRKSSSRSLSASYKANFMLDEPALMTAIQPLMVRPLGDRGLDVAASRCRNQHGDGSRGEPRQPRVGPAGQNDRDPRAQHDAGGIGACEKREAL